MPTPDDRRFAESAVKSGFLSPAVAAKVLDQLASFPNVTFADLAIRLRTMSLDHVLIVAEKIGSIGKSAPSNNSSNTKIRKPSAEVLEKTPRAAKKPELPAAASLAPERSHEAAEPPTARSAPRDASRGKRRKEATLKINLNTGLVVHGFDIRQYLVAARVHGASDLHVTVGRSPFVRLHGALTELEGDPVTADEAERTAFELAGPERAAEMRQRQQGEFLMKDEEGRRYRCCVVRQRLGWDLSVRLIRETIPTVEELGIPEKLLKLTQFQQGLVLIAGPSGSGKSSTLAALLGAINRSRDGHIITVEDPVEYVLEPDRCHVTQRELHRHTESHAAALRAALRQNPDVIAIGELRDRETASIAISAAETGHLVFATLHTGTATRTVSCIVDMFPPSQRQQLLTMLSESIRGIICQQLVPGADRQSRHLALEVLLFTPAVAALVRDDKTAPLVNQMQTGKKLGMCRLDDSLEELVRAKKIAPEEAAARAEAKERFMRVGGR